MVDTHKHVFFFFFFFPLGGGQSQLFLLIPIEAVIGDNNYYMNTDADWWTRVISRGMFEAKGYRT